jgi:crotonobetainyl-CoA:carnitine CoA-transferase CaiB-like acyl-CoA transferase
MQRIFDGLRIVDFTTNVAGPFTTAFLADFGAEVIKIEKPKLGDDSRFFSPQIDGVGIPFCWNNRGKKSLVLDMADSEAIEIAFKLISTADIVIESFKPGTMRKFGLDYEALKQINPKIIFCSVSGFGQNGPYSSKPGYDMIAQALSGAMDMTGDPSGPPMRMGLAIADYNAGIHALAGISAALYYRERTGQGQLIDISLLDCMVGVNGLIEIAGIGKKPTRSGNHHGSLAPFGVYEGANGSLIICAPAQGPWKSLCRLMGRPEMFEDPQYANTGARAKNIIPLIAAIEGWLKSFPNVDEPWRLMDEAGIPSAKVNTTNQALDNPQLIAREMIIELATPDGVSQESIKARGNPLKFSADKATPSKAPALGQHEAEILSSIGYDDAAISRVKEKWGIV